MGRILFNVIGYSPVSSGGNDNRILPRQDVLKESLNKQ
jgi:hypothetical protein